MMLDVSVGLRCEKSVLIFRGIIIFPVICLSACSVYHHYSVCVLSLSLSAGPSIGSLFHMADDLGRAMESLVNVMTDEQSAEQHEALPF